MTTTPLSSLPGLTRQSIPYPAEHFNFGHGMDAMVKPWHDDHELKLP
jgi:hypothetical protein